MRGAWRILGAAVLLSLFSAAHAQTTAPAEGVREFALVRQQLASSDFAQREAGQKALDQMPAAQVEFLRTQAQAEMDPEVKARLDARVDAMDCYVLTHPAPVSIDVAKATLAQVVQQLNAQLGGGDPIQTSGASSAVYTLTAKDQPFWEVITQLNKQSSLNVSALTSLTVSGTTNNIRLTPSSVAREYRMSDTFALSPQVVGTPSNGTWSIRFVVLSDPRVRITQYSQLRLDKILDQNGVSLMPLVVTNTSSVSNVVRPVVSWTASVSLNEAPTVTRIKELHGGVAISVVEQEKLITMDLTKAFEPVVTPRGKISIDKQVGGNGVTLHVDPVVETPAPVAALQPTTANRNYITIRAVTENGSTLTTTVTGGRMSINLSPGGQPPSKVEISWIEKSRDMVIPVEWTDLAVPAPAVVQPNPANPAVRPMPMIELR